MNTTLSYQEACALFDSVADDDTVAMYLDPIGELMRHIISYPRTLSIHNGLIYEYNCCHQGVLKGHTSDDVAWLVNQGYIRITPGHYSGGVEATKKGFREFKGRTAT